MAVLTFDETTTLQIAFPTATSEAVQEFDPTDFTSPTDAEIDTLLAQADSLTSTEFTTPSTTFPTSIPILQTHTTPHKSALPPSDIEDAEVDEILRMAANVEGLLDLISPARGYTGNLDSGTVKALQQAGRVTAGQGSFRGCKAGRQKQL
ncbi:hypothetical protein HDU98_006883 [Podochytrium sp. JEL0797]|nr:hypothetical protein HDU98_006883 [Podochytrium sp. JEL0797]